MARSRVRGPDGRELVLDDGVLAPYRARLDAAIAAAGGAEPASVRLAYAAAHVAVPEAYANAPHTSAAPAPAEEIPELLDWDATLAFRRRLDAHGFAVAEAMDTAQRFTLGWPAAKRLIQETGGLGLRHGFVAGAGSEGVSPSDDADALVATVVRQAGCIQEAGGEVIVLPMPWLSAAARDADTYVAVYEAIFRELDGPLYVHWLGEAFLPAMRGYFPGDSFSRVLALDPAKVRGAKLSLLDADREVELRRELAEQNQLMLTGDDLHFARLLRGGDAREPASVSVPPTGTTRVGARTVATGDFSHALLGVLDAIHVPAGLALRLLAVGDVEGFLELMLPCEALGRALFEPPTHAYKAGLAWLAWLTSAQPNRMLLHHEQRARDAGHYARITALASEAGVILDAEASARRLRAL